MDFGKLISDPELLKKIKKEQPQSVEEMRKMVKGIEGLKVKFYQSRDHRFQVKDVLGIQKNV